MSRHSITGYWERLKRPWATSSRSKTSSNGSAEATPSLGVTLGQEVTALSFKDSAKQIPPSGPSDDDKLKFKPVCSEISGAGEPQSLDDGAGSDASPRALSQETPSQKVMSPLTLAIDHEATASSSVNSFKQRSPSSPPSEDNPRPNATEDSIDSIEEAGSIDSGADTNGSSTAPIPEAPVLPGFALDQEVTASSSKNSLKQCSMSPRSPPCNDKGKRKPAEDDISEIEEVQPLVDGADPNGSPRAGSEAPASPSRASFDGRRAVTPVANLSVGSGAVADGPRAAFFPRHGAAAFNGGRAASSLGFAMDRNGTASAFRDLIERRKPLPPADEFKAEIGPAQDDIGRLEEETQRNHQLSETARLNFDRLRQRQNELASLRKRQDELESQLGKAIRDKQMLKGKLDEMTTNWETLQERHREMANEKESLEAELRGTEESMRRADESVIELEILRSKIQILVDGRELPVDDKTVLINEKPKLGEAAKSHQDAEARHARSELLDLEKKHQQVLRERDKALKDRETFFLRNETLYEHFIKLQHQRGRGHEKILQERTKQCDDLKKVVAEITADRDKLHQELETKCEDITTTEKLAQEWERKYIAVVTEKKEAVQQWQNKNKELYEKYEKQRQELSDRIIELEGRCTSLCAQITEKEAEHVEYLRTVEEWTERKSEFEEEIKTLKESFAEIEKKTVKKEEELATLEEQYTAIYEECRVMKAQSAALQAQNVKWQGEYSKHLEEFTVQQEQWETDYDHLRARFSEQLKQWQIDYQKLREKLEANQEKWREDYEKLEALSTDQQRRLENDYQKLLARFVGRVKEYKQLREQNTSLEIKYERLKTENLEWRKDFESSYNKSVDRLTKGRFVSDEAAWGHEFADLHMRDVTWERMYKNLVAVLENPEKALDHLVVQLEANNQLLESIALVEAERDEGERGR